MASPPFRKGTQSIVTLFIAGQKTDPLTAESWSVKKNTEEISDGVNGESADRLDSELKSYSLSLKCFNESAAKWKTLVGYDQNLIDDAAPTIQFGVKIQERGGSSSFTLTECVIDGWEWASGGRTGRMMLTIPIRGRHFKELQ